MNDSEIRNLTRQLLLPLYSNLGTVWSEGFEHRFSTFCQKPYWPDRAEEMMLVALEVLAEEEE